MPLLGAHMSISGGLHKAVEAAAGLQMDTVQIFTNSPSQWAVKAVIPAGNKGEATSRSKSSAVQWQAKQFTDDEVRMFKTAIADAGIQSPCAHNSYLINLASPERDLWDKSLEALVVELERAEALGLIGVVMHPGSYVSSTEDEGLARIARALDDVHRRTSGFASQLLLECTAGQGTNLGHRFEHLAQIVNDVRAPERLGICLDTCHLFAAGYALSSAEDYAATLGEFDRLVGIGRIRAFHLNDSVREFGSRVDRHARIGGGKMGLDPFRLLLNDPRFARTPMYMETPKGEEEGEQLDAINLRTLRQLVKRQTTDTKPSVARGKPRGKKST